MSLIRMEKHEVKSFEEFEANLRCYSQHRDALRNRYMDQYVAVLNGDVIAHARSLKGLFKKVPDNDRRRVIVDFLTENEKLIL